MGKPRMIILIRHAQSEGNKNRDIHQTVPDHRVKLTPEGWKQAAEAGNKLRSLLHPSDTLHFFTSPYRRTRETTEGILDTLTSSTPTPSPFPRSAIKVYEEPRLREQDFGNFQPSSAEMSAMWKERANYGHFFYRIPNGESAADAYDRVSGFNESLWRSFSEEDFARVCVLVTHGLMTRVFLMKWYHFSVEYFEDLRNVNHCEFVVMKLNPDSGKFILQNQLRTWSGLRKEQAEAMAPPESPIPVRKRWGDYSEQDAGWFGRRQLARRQNTADLFLDDSEHGDWATNNGRHYTGIKGGDKNKDNSGDTAKESKRERIEALEQEEGASNTLLIMGKGMETVRIGTPSPFQQNRMVKGGRDGGGSRSGAGSPAYSSTDSDSEVRDRLQALPVRTRSMAMALHGELSSVDVEEAANARADALGDQDDGDDPEQDVY